MQAVNPLQLVHRYELGLLTPFFSQHFKQCCCNDQ